MLTSGSACMHPVTNGEWNNIIYGRKIPVVWDDYGNQRSQDVLKVAKALKKVIIKMRGDYRWRSSDKRAHKLT